MGGLRPHNAIASFRLRESHNEGKSFPCCCEVLGRTEATVFDFVGRRTFELFGFRLSPDAGDMRLHYQPTGERKPRRCYLGELKRPYLTALEEKLLSLLEAEIKD